MCREEGSPHSEEPVHPEPGRVGDRDLGDLHPAHPDPVPVRGQVVPRPRGLQAGADHAGHQHPRVYR